MEKHRKRVSQSGWNFFVYNLYYSDEEGNNLRRIYRNIIRLVEFGLSLNDYLNWTVSDINNFIKIANELKNEENENIERMQNQPKEVPKINTLSTVYKNQTTNMPLL